MPGEHGPAEMPKAVGLAHDDQCESHHGGERKIELQSEG